MSTTLAIDPGNTESAYAIIGGVNCRPILIGKVPNRQLLAMIARDDRFRTQNFAVEMLASYGMAVGDEVFETCVWIGRFTQLSQDLYGLEPSLVKRLPVKQHHCHDSRANDANITQALVDRFAYGQSNHGKGTKASPGWFYGFSKDIWQAYALAVYVSDTAQ